MENSRIAWTHHTFNLHIGCTQCSEECKNCYAKKEDGRNKLEPVSHWGPGAPRYELSEAYWKKPYSWNKKAEAEGTRKRVFCGSMCDWCDDEAPLGVRGKLWYIIRNTPMLDWLLLTKRENNIVGFLPPDWGTSGYPNVWLGVSCGNKKNGYPRIDVLRWIPAAVRFLSVEPMLEDMSNINLTGIDWVICGGESGSKAREFDVQWARNLRRVARTAGVAFFMKQVGSNPWENDSPFYITYSQEDGKEDYSGHVIQNFPADLQIRKLPVVMA
jgi:protein gp37